MRTEHAAVGVHLIDHHVLQVLEELRPFGVMRQDALVQHVGIGDDDVAVRANRLARVTGRVAIKGIGPHAEVARPVEFQQFRDLVLREGFGRKKIERLERACIAA